MKEKTLKEIGLDSWYHVGLIVFMRYVTYTKLNLKLDIKKQVNKEIQEIEELVNCKITDNVENICIDVLAHINDTFCQNNLQIK